MPGLGRARRRGSRSRSASPGAISPISGCSPTTGGCRPWNVHRRAAARRRTRPRSAARRASTAGRGASSPISQFTRTVITGSPSTVPSHVKRCAATVPASITPTGVSSRHGRDRHLVRRALLGVERPAELGRDHVDRLHEAVAEDRRASGSCAASSGGLPNSMTSRTTMLGRVVADVGELLGAHVADVAAQRRQHQREPLGDAAGVDAGAVQRDVARRCTRPRARRRRACRRDRSSRPASRRSCPTRAARITSRVLASTGE